MPRTLLIVATYNERENLPQLVEDVLRLDIDGLDILVVDDNSPDGTGELADELAETHPEVRVLHREGKLGLGTAYIAGMEKARSEGYDVVATMDADFSHNPKYLPALVKGMDEHDVVIGSRYVPGGGTRNWGVVRRLMSWGANAFVRLGLGLKPRDCSGGFRCYRLALIGRLDLDQVIAKGYAFQEEMLYRCQLLGARIGEVPIIFEDRRRGESKMSLGEIWGLFTAVIHLRWRRLTGRLALEAGKETP